VSDQDNKPWEWGDKGVPQNPINHYPEGTRFLCCGYDGHMNQFSQGNWVRHEDYAKLQMERIHDLNQMGGLCEENARLKAEVERLKEGNECLDQMHEKEMARSAFLCEHIERLTKAVMHSPAAQLKLKELEGKTTFDEINPDNQ
jgi:hypothetical protein